MPLTSSAEGSSPVTSSQKAPSGKATLPPAHGGEVGESGRNPLVFLAQKTEKEVFLAESSCVLEELEVPEVTGFFLNERSKQASRHEFPKNPLFQNRFSGAFAPLHSRSRRLRKEA